MDKTSITDAICKKDETRKVGKISTTENSGKLDGTAEMGKMGRQLKRIKDKIQGTKKRKMHLVFQYSYILARYRTF